MQVTNSISRMVTLLLPLLVFLVGPTAVASAQDNPAAPGEGDPLSGHSQFVYGYVKAILLSSAEKMPEENYSFKPTEAVRTYGQLIGHLADSQYMFCSIVLGEQNPALNVEKSKTSKADLVAALRDACTYCERAYSSVTDLSGAQTVKLMGREMPKLGVLNINAMHSMEHYGNLVTYLRMKNLVPPTSEPGFGPPQSK
jgi:uncharacterized damage-inducible protein DinB